jgi:Kef-type K+ transport system membrane component KefB
VQWSLLLAVAAMAGYLIQRHTGLPKVVGYSLVGTAAGLAGFSGAVWPLQGIGLFLLELGIAIVLFECGGRIRCAGSATTPWCWCRALPSRP